MNQTDNEPMFYNKLVRDKIPELICDAMPIVHVADDVEYEAALRRKLQEEMDEFLADPSAEEAADVLEVMHALCALHGVDLSTLEDVRQKKVNERGGFSGRVILDRTEELKQA